MPTIRALTAVPYGAHPRQAFDLFVPEDADGRATVVCMHGGWWSQGHHHDLRLTALHLAEQGIPTATLGHRLLGDGARGGQDIVDDLRAGLAKLVDEAGLLDASTRNVVLLGSGSGSLFALALGALSHLEPKFPVRVRAVVACGVTPSIDPWEGCPLAMTRVLHAVAAGHGHQWNPPTLKAEAFPPLLLLHGDADAEVPAKSAAKLHQRVIDAGEESAFAVLTGVGHQFIENPYDRAGKDAMDRIVPFLHEHVPAAMAGLWEARAPMVGGDDR